MKARELKLALWQDIVYMLFIFVGPVIITCIELFESHSSVLKLSFASVGALLTVLIVTKKFIFNRAIDKCKQEIFNLEHDYSVAIGDDNLIIAKWRKYNLILYSFNALAVLLSIVLLTLFVNALADGLIAFRGAILLILLFVIVGLIFKLLCYLFLGKEGKQNGEET